MAATGPRGSAPALDWSLAIGWHRPRLDERSVGLRLVADELLIYEIVDHAVATQNLIL